MGDSYARSRVETIGIVATLEAPPKDLYKNTVIAISEAMRDGKINITTATEKDQANFKILEQALTSDNLKTQEVPLKNDQLSLFRTTAKEQLSNYVQLSEKIAYSNDGDFLHSKEQVESLVYDLDKAATLLEKRSLTKGATETYDQNKTSNPHNDLKLLKNVAEAKLAEVTADEEFSTLQQKGYDPSNIKKVLKESSQTLAEVQKPEQLQPKVDAMESKLLGLYQKIIDKTDEKWSKQWKDEASGLFKAPPKGIQTARGFGPDASVDNFLDFFKSKADETSTRGRSSTTKAVYGTAKEFSKSDPSEQRIEKLDAAIKTLKGIDSKVHPEHYQKEEQTPSTPSPGSPSH